MTFPEVTAKAVPYVTAQQMGEVDRLMTDRYRISLLQMMENAGRSLALVARDRILGGNALGGRVVVLAGGGGNGGGGLVCARRLSAWGLRKGSRELAGLGCDPKLDALSA